MISRKLLFYILFYVSTHSWRHFTWNLPPCFAVTLKGKLFKTRNVTWVLFSYKRMLNFPQGINVDTLTFTLKIITLFLSLNKSGLKNKDLVAFQRLSTYVKNRHGRKNDCNDEKILVGRRDTVFISNDLILISFNKTDHPSLLGVKLNRN